MMIMNLTTTICISAASLIFFENICQNFEAKMLSTFSTTSTILKTNKIIDKITLIQNTTFFYKNQKKERFFYITLHFLHINCKFGFAKC